MAFAFTIRVVSYNLTNKIPISLPIRSGLFAYSLLVISLFDPFNVLKYLFN